MPRRNFKNRLVLLLAAGVLIFGAPIASLAQDSAAPQDTADMAAMKAPGNPHIITLNELSGMAKLPESDQHAVMLTDGSFEGDATEKQPTMVIISSDAAGDSAQDRDIDLELFAAVMMYTNTELFKSIKAKDTRLLTIADFPSAEVIAKAKGVKSGEKLMVVQWMMFGENGKFIKMMGFAPRKQFDAALPRFEAIRDGLVVGP